MSGQKRVCWGADEGFVYWVERGWAEGEKRHRGAGKRTGEKGDTEGNSPFASEGESKEGKTGTSHNGARWDNALVNPRLKRR